MATPSRFALQSATTPGSLLAELEKFIVFWLGPRQEQFGEPIALLDGHQIPEPLRRLYAFAGRWKRPLAHVEGETRIFSIEEHLRTLDQLETTPDGKLIFLDENQGNWTCATLAQGDDPPVWVEDVFENYGQGKWGLVTDSLSQFLVTFCLRELLAGSQMHLSDERLERWFASLKAEAVPLWTGGSYPNWQETFSYFLLHGSVLVGDIGGSVWFGANREEGIQLLNTHQGEIREVGLALESSWSLTIRPDGSASLTLPGKFDATAHTAPGAFDFASVRDRLRAACTEDGPRSNSWYATFPRKGQTSCWGMGLKDPRTAEALFRQVLESAVSKEANYDELMQKFPPQL